VLTLAEQADPLIDAEQCSRDAALMKTLGTNALRVYHVDPGADHDKCMSVFDNAGIYLMIDLDTFDTYILPVSAVPNPSPGPGPGLERANIC